MPRIQQLRYLVAIADTLSFSRAAEACHVTQPTLSMQVKEMEQRLGVRLIERTRARVILTPVGAEIARRARTVLADVEDIREIARRDDPEALQGNLLFGVVQTVGAYVLSVAMPALRTTFPQLRVVIREDRIETLPEKLSDGTYEALLLPDQPHHHDLTSALLLREPLHVVLPSDHRLAQCEMIDPEDLAGETILTMERGHRIHDPIAALCERVGAIHARDYAGTTLDTLRLMVATGMGITLLPALYVRSDVLRETLVVARPLSYGAPFRNLTMSWRTTSPRQRTYVLLAATISECLTPWGLTNPASPAA
jgi:LysR family hydrogen peroxide-inducible transcriptional activator